MDSVEKQIEKINRYIETSLDFSIKRVQDFIRQCSVTSNRNAVLECAQLLRNMLADIGCKDARLIETDGNPIVFGEFSADSPYILLVYTMYDTQPFNKDVWHFDPLGGEIVKAPSGDEVIYGRGAINSKGPLIAFINAVDAILKTAGELPVGLKIVADGEEEIGSPSFKRYLEENPTQLKADACLVVTPGGSKFLGLGYKGIVVLELECNATEWGKGPSKGNVHSKFKPVLDSPAWHLAKALTTLVGDDEDTILIEGFYDNEYEPVPSEIDLIDKLSETIPVHFLSRLGPLPDKLKDCQVKELIEKILFKPSINISRLASGHSTEQISTIIPAVAKCTMDIRFFGQEGETLIDKLKNHLRTKGYDDIKVKKLALLPWYRVDIDEPIVQAVLKSYNDLGFNPQIWPNDGAACFTSVIGRSINLPVIEGGSISGGGGHGPDEFVVAKTNSKRRAGLLECEKSYVSILYNFPIFASDKNYPEK